MSEQKAGGLLPLPKHPWPEDVSCPLLLYPVPWDSVNQNVRESRKKRMLALIVGRQGWEGPIRSPCWELITLLLLILAVSLGTQMAAVAVVQCPSPPSIQSVQLMIPAGGYWHRCEGKKGIGGEE